MNYPFDGCGDYIVKDIIGFFVQKLKRVSLRIPSPTLNF